MDERPVAHPVPASDLDARDELQALSSLPLEERKARLRELIWQAEKLLAGKTAGASKQPRNSS